MTEEEKLAQLGAIKRNASEMHHTVAINYVYSIARLAATRGCPSICREL